MLLHSAYALIPVTDVVCVLKSVHMKCLNYQAGKLKSSEEIIAWSVEPAP